MQKILVYVHDPMCSWCYGFEPVRQQIFSRLQGRMEIIRLLGGLAPDSDAPMPESTQAMIRQAWQRIEQVIPGTEFNYDFWTLCQPKRSTYPANRAVIAARLQGAQYEQKMTARIQQAYYREARNPSESETLVELAGEIGLDKQRFDSDLASVAVEQQLMAEIQQARSIGIDSFPSVAVIEKERLLHIGLDYNDAEAMLSQIEAA